MRVFDSRWLTSFSLVREASTRFRVSVYQKKNDKSVLSGYNPADRNRENESRGDYDISKIFELLFLVPDLAVSCSPSCRRGMMWCFLLDRRTGVFCRYE
jgi:hypothetical protein